MSPSVASPWVEAFRQHLHLLGRGQLAPALAAKVDLSGVVQQTLAECAGVPPPADDVAALRLLRVAFLNNLRDAIALWTTAKRDARREVRQSVGEASSADDPIATLAALTTPSVQHAKKELEERLMVAVASLPEEQRTAVYLHHLVELSVRETAFIMDRTEGQVAYLLHQGLEELRGVLAEPTSTE